MLFEKQIEEIYRSNLFVRNDNAGGIFYFTPEDFPGLLVHPYAFPAKQGHTLQGWFYHYDNPIPGRLLVFDHGLGNGHRAYMREIELLAKSGYLVFAYDHTGCMESGGESTNGFAQSLCDLDACITALKQVPELEGRTISVMGHSWGGFSTMNIAALHPDITHVISMSGFVSVELIMEQTISGILAPYRKALLALERRSNPDYVDFDARESLKDTQAKVLLIYSSNDRTVSKNVHYDALQKALSGKPNIRFLLVHGKDHSPNYTADAVAYKNKFFEELTKAQKKKQLQTPAQQKRFMAGYDWHRMTAQDSRVWTIILDYLKA
ncbi:MAG: alpha/beta fold hydrolase [Oscillospiraceae bacterium]|nr:alpha/beta fold hydrolase [Oscillospiraceae bacterium]